MKTLIVAISAFFTFNAFAADEWHSVYTDLKKDCVLVSGSTDQAEIDFRNEECKSFGGYRLSIAGGDIRYSPRLSFSGEEIDLQSPGAFHDMGSEMVEWLYTRKSDVTGFGSIEWKGVIYRLSVHNEPEQRSDSVLYVVRLNGAESCLLGKVQTNKAARALAKDAKARCQ